MELYLLLRSGLIDTYQPVPLVGIANAQRYRSTLDRWRAIQQELGDMKGSGIDIGCNLGFFTFQMAQKGFFCIGLEGDAFLHYLCNLARDASGQDRVAFARMVVNEHSVQLLPSVNVILFLSVFHHMVRYYGMESSTRIVVSLMERAHVIFFETGQSNEMNTSWARYLPAMEPTPQEWIANYFKSLGASRVKHLGEFETHLSPVRRSLFAIYTAKK